MCPVTLNADRSRTFHYFCFSIFQLPHSISLILRYWSSLARNSHVKHDKTGAGKKNFFEKVTSEVCLPHQSKEALSESKAGFIFWGGLFSLAIFQLYQWWLSWFYRLGYKWPICKHPCFQEAKLPAAWFCLDIFANLPRKPFTGKQNFMPFSEDTVCIFHLNHAKIKKDSRALSRYLWKLDKSLSHHA